MKSGILFLMTAAFAACGSPGGIEVPAPENNDSSLPVRAVMTEQEANEYAEHLAAVALLGPDVPPDGGAEGLGDVPFVTSYSVDMAEGDISISIESFTRGGSYILSGATIAALMSAFDAWGSKPVGPRVYVGCRDGDTGSGDGGNMYMVIADSSLGVIIDNDHQSPSPRKIKEDSDDED